MSTTHTLSPAQDEVLTPHDGFSGQSEVPDGPRVERLSLIEEACESFVFEVVDELASIRSILGAASAGDTSAAASAASRDAIRVPPSPPYGPSEETVRAVNGRPESSAELKRPASGDALKGHDRIAALKERLAEKLRCETNRPPQESSVGNAPFALKEVEES